MNGYNSNLHTPIVLIIVVVTLVVPTITYNAKAAQFEIDDNTVLCSFRIKSINQTKSVTRLCLMKYLKLQTQLTK